ncbi:MAG: B12-binding domain-containing radical SAM protein [Desulfobulbaceae bacterium]|nr:B12-binding domain-containing radical SAM protein [Desulfobulbaceae bacterium]
MNYLGNVIRPPSEANSIILQVTVGCSYNNCTFCGAYKDIAFQMKDQDTIDADLEFAKRHYQNKKRLFLADGDVLILSQRRLIQLFSKIRKHLPWITRISLYGNARAIRNKTVNQLEELKSMGLDRVYMGLESGCDKVLTNVKKGETAKTMTAAAIKIRQTGIFLSVTTLLGLGGVTLSAQHAVETAEVLNKMSPNQIAALTLMPLKNTELGEEVAAGKFILPSPSEILQELHLLVSHLKNVKCQFHANHASSYLPIAGRLPRDKNAFLASIEMALKGTTPLVPDYRRAL